MKKILLSTMLLASFAAIAQDGGSQDCGSDGSNCDGGSGGCSDSSCGGGTRAKRKFEKQADYGSLLKEARASLKKSNSFSRLP